MRKRNLNKDWKLTVLGENVYEIPQEPIVTTVPSSVYSTLLENNLMPDPFFRDNEKKAYQLMKNDFLYETEFCLQREELDADKLFLRFDGIDTIADIYLDEKKIGYAENMNRVWEYDITEFAADDSKQKHHLKVHLHSPILYVQQKNEECPVGTVEDGIPGVPHIRKAACMFGWDWGPRLPDAGIFREVSIEAVHTARFSDVRVEQIHHVSGKNIHGNITDAVTLRAYTQTERTDPEDRTELEVVMEVTGPDGAMHYSSGAEIPQVEIRHPRLWWPNGYGKQDLYDTRIYLKNAKTGEILDEWQKKTGLRTVTVNTDPMPEEVLDSHMKGQMPDYDDGNDMILSQGNRKIIVAEKAVKQLEGRNFAFEVNGLQIFAMGADYIPEDNLLTRQNRERTDLLLASAQESHFNCLRVWGGGYFLDDFFYDICDERGLLIWHDLMFACASYELTDAFEKNISEEIRQNIRRLRSHACIALWCGNNEMETQYEGLTWPKSRKQYYDYIRLYEYIIPKIVKEEDPGKFYWPSSPSSGGNFENSNAENIGDAHYWGVWHGNEPFTAYRKHHYRFLSEFGFQSFPALPVVRRFTEKEDRNIYSRVMETHQRSGAANGKIMNYISQTYLYPKNFDELLYCSQLLQADAIRYGVEHFRRFRGTCMGAVVWQLNDIWPVASWAGVDYYGNWKALQYAEKKMFAPVLLSCEEHGEVDQKSNVNVLADPLDISADLHVANETGETVTGMVKWSLRNPDSDVLKEGEFAVTVLPYSGTWLPHLDFSDEDPLEVHLAYELIVENQVISSGTSLFCAPKYYHFADPKLTVSVEGNTVRVTAEKFAKAVSVEAENMVLRMDDNFVDMEAGTKTFHILPGRDFTQRENRMPENYRVRSVYEIAERE